MAAGSQRGASHVTRVPREFLENDQMSGPRLERILASTALALILAAPIGASAIPQDAATAGQAAAAAGAAAVARREATAAPSAAPAATSETATAAQDAVVPAPATNPAAASEQAAAPDPLAALDPADRAVAEKIRDLLA